jgi:TP901 family phage tail tape measure protein
LLYRVCFTAVDKFSGPMKQMGNAVQGFVSRSERLLGRANAAFSKLMTPLTGINKMLMGFGVYIGLFTLVRVIKNAIDVFANFQQANADLAVVMGTTVKENRALANEARRIGLAYGESATEVVKMQHALATLGFERSDILTMGRPLITGSAALEGANPEKLAETVGAVINSFDNLVPKDTQHILDVMALGANRTALNFEKLAATLPIVSGPANAVGISFERLIALLGILQNAGVHVQTSATSLKNIFIDSAKKGHTYEQVLANIAKNSDKLVAANKKFGKRSVGFCAGFDSAHE